MQVTLRIALLLHLSTLIMSYSYAPKMLGNSSTDCDHQPTHSTASFHHNYTLYDSIATTRPLLSPPHPPHPTNHVHHPHHHPLTSPLPPPLHARLPPRRPSLGPHHTLHPPRRAQLPTPTTPYPSPPLKSWLHQKQGVEGVFYGAGSVEMSGLCGAAGGESDGECVVLFADWEGW